MIVSHNADFIRYKLLINKLETFLSYFIGKRNQNHLYDELSDKPMIHLIFTWFFICFINNMR